MKKYISIILSLISALAFLLLSIPSLADTSLEQVIEGIRHRYGKEEGFRVEYVRELLTPSMALLKLREGDKAGGTIYFKPPCLLRLEQRFPTHEYIISGSKYIWWFLPDKKEAYRYKKEQFSEEFNILIDILAGFREMGFNMEIVSESSNKIQLLIKGFKAPSHLESIKVNIEKGTWTIKVIEIHDISGQITTFYLKDIRRDIPIKDDMFNFKVPLGVRVMEE